MPDDDLSVPTFLARSHKQTVSDDERTKMPLSGKDALAAMKAQSAKVTAKRAKKELRGPKTNAALSNGGGFLLSERAEKRYILIAKRFIERNRDILLRYWNCEIDTAELIKQLK